MLVKYDKTPIRVDEFEVDLWSSVPRELLRVLTRNGVSDYVYRYRKYVLKSNDVGEITAGRARALAS